MAGETVVAVGFVLVGSGTTEGVSRRSGLLILAAQNYWQASAQLLKVLVVCCTAS